MLSYVCVSFGPCRAFTKLSTSPVSSSPDARTAYGIEIAAASLASMREGCAAAPTLQGVPEPDVAATTCLASAPILALAELRLHKSSVEDERTYLGAPAEAESSELRLGPVVCTDGFDETVYGLNSRSGVGRTAEEGAKRFLLLLGVGWEPRWIDIRAAQEVWDVHGRAIFDVAEEVGALGTKFECWS